MNITTEIYSITRKYPRDEIYGLISQMRRSSVSIPSNIAEGKNRYSAREFIRFLNITKASLAELETQIEISNNLRYLEDNDYDLLIKKIERLNKMMTVFILNIKKNL